MQRPGEFETLISQHFFTITPALIGGAEAFLQSAEEQLSAFHLLCQAGISGAAFGAAYDGLSQLFQAVFEYYEVRAPAEFRTSITGVICRSLDMHPAEQCLISRANDRRHQLLTECPFPQPSPDEGRALARVLAKYIPVVRAIVTATKA
jgi:hypothetical protein